MLLPKGINPLKSAYYNGYLIIKFLKRKSSTNFLELFEHLQSKYKMSINLFLTAMDWLFLIDLVNIEDGVVRLNDN